MLNPLDLYDALGYSFGTINEQDIMLAKSGAEEIWDLAGFDFYLKNTEELLDRSVNNENMNNSIVVALMPDNAYYVLDGHHRIWSHYRKNSKSINVYVIDFSTNVLPINPYWIPVERLVPKPMM